MNLLDVLLHPDEYDGLEVSIPWRPVIGDTSSVLHVLDPENFSLAPIKAYVAVSAAEVLTRRNEK